MDDTPVNDSPHQAFPAPLQAKLFLMGIALRSGGKGYYEIRSKKLGGGMDCAFFGVREIDEGVAYALEVGAKTDTYVGMGLRDGRRGSADAVDSVSMLWVDCDSDEALDGLDAFSPYPSIIVRSGGLTERRRPKLHAYWPLGRALPAEGVKPALQRLVAAIGADPACVDAARIMRVPGTFNFKSDPPAPVVLEVR